MGTVKADENRLYTSAEVSQIVRKRLAQAQRTAAAKLQAYSTSKLPWATEERSTEATESREIPEETMEERAQRILSQYERFTQELYVRKDDHIGSRYLKGASEALADITVMVEEVRSEQRALSEGEERAVLGLEAAADAIRKNITMVEDHLKQILRPVEERSTPEREEQIILDYAFKPDAVREQIRADVLKRHQDADPVSVVLRRAFERK
jgi:hypothetical protein